MRLLVIDSNALLHRAFHALPPLTTKKGEQTGAIYGFLLILFRAIKDIRPDFIVATFDTPAPTFRHKEFKEYKATRPKVPEELSQQIPKAKEILEVFKIPIFAKDGFEADDLIGTISKFVSMKERVPKIETVILSGDLDVLQLVNSHTKAYMFKRGVKETIMYDTKTVKERYGITPEQLTDLKALKGDPSDNIPGVPGVGEKTASKIIQEFGSLEHLYQALEKEDKLPKWLTPKLKEALLKAKEQAFLSKKLNQIKKDAPIDFNLEKCQWKDYDKEEVVQIFKALDFNTLIKRLPELEGKSQDQQNNETSPVNNNLKLF